MPATRCPEIAPEATAARRGPDDMGSPRGSQWMRIAFALAAGGLVMAGLASLASRAKHPALQLLHTAAFGTATDRREARNTLLAQSRESAPLLVRVVRQSKSRWRSDILPWFETIPQVADFRTRQLRMERVAIELLQLMGPETAPALLPLLSERRFGGRDTALALIHSRGPAVCPVLISTLSDPDPVLRSGAAMALGKFPSQTPQILPALLDARHDRAAVVRGSALWALGQYLDVPAKTVPPLIEGLRDPDRSVRQQALQALRSFPTELVPALPALREILRNDSLALRCESAHLLALAGPVAREAEPELVQLLTHSSDLGRRQGALALIQLDLQTDRAFETLRRLLSRSDQPFLAKTLEGIGAMGPRATPLVPRLLELLDNDTPRDDRPTLVALRQIQPDAIPERFRRNRPTGRP